MPPGLLPEFYRLAEKAAQVDQDRRTYGDAVVDFALKLNRETPWDYGTCLTMALRAETEHGWPGSHVRLAELQGVMGALRRAAQVRVPPRTGRLR